VRLLYVSLLISLSILKPFNVKSQKSEKKDWGIKFGGFVKTDFWLDSRQLVTAREGIVALYPKNIDPDNNGNDINAGTNFNFSAITSRISGKITGPDAFKAKTSGILEADFSGNSNSDINGFRLRYAFVQLKWKNRKLLCGQFWHPMFVTDVFPTVNSLNLGVPFQPFIRSPQVTFTQSIKNLNIIVSALSQRDYSNIGPIGVSPTYQSQAVIPNGHIQVQYKTSKHTFGIAADAKVLRPQLATDSLYITDATISSFAGMFYYKYSNKKICIKTKSIYGQNMTEHLLLGGYAIKSRDSLTMKETYTATNHLFSWANITYGDKVKVGIFGGYGKNLGTTHDNIGIYYSRDYLIDYVYRFSSMVHVKSDAFHFVTEVEATTAAYGTPDVDGKVLDSKEVTGIRLLFTVLYFF